MWSAPESADAKYGFLGANPAPMVTLFILASEIVLCDEICQGMCNSVRLSLSKFTNLRFHEYRTTHSYSEKISKREILLKNQ